MDYAAISFAIRHEFKIKSNARHIAGHFLQHIRTGFDPATMDDACLR